MTYHIMNTDSSGKISFTCRKGIFHTLLYSSQPWLIYAHIQINHSTFIYDEFISREKITSTHPTNISPLIPHTNRYICKYDCQFWLSYVWLPLVNSRIYCPQIHTHLSYATLQFPKLPLLNWPAKILCISGMVHILHKALGGSCQMVLQRYQVVSAIRQVPGAIKKIKKEE